MKLKYMLIGTVIGILLTVAGTAFASPAIKEISAYLRPDYHVTIGDKEVKLEKSPIVYEGDAYLNVKEMGVLLGRDITWNESTTTIGFSGCATLSILGADGNSSEVPVCSKVTPTTGSNK